MAPDSETLAASWAQQTKDDSITPISQNQQNPQKQLLNKKTLQQASDTNDANFNNSEEITSNPPVNAKFIPLLRLTKQDSSSTKEQKPFAFEQEVVEDDDQQDIVVVASSPKILQSTQLVETSLTVSGTVNTGRAPSAHNKETTTKTTSRILLQ